LKPMLRSKKQTVKTTMLLEDLATGVILLVNLAMTTKKMLKKQLRLLFSDET